VAELIRGLDADVIRASLARVHDEIAAAGRAPGEVQVLAAVKYVALEELPVLAQAGLTLLGENRAQDLEAKASAHREFTWDFIGNIQSRKVRSIVRFARYIHSVATDSVLEQLGRYGTSETKVMVEVNVAGEPGKGGIEPDALGAFIERCPVPVVGLMTMPPQTPDPERSRPYFAALRDLAATHGLSELSMGTSQDYRVAVAEGATIVRLGSSLYRQT
jgi:PLP dependent protein